MGRVRARWSLARSAKRRLRPPIVRARPAEAAQTLNDIEKKYKNKSKLNPRINIRNSVTRAILGLVGVWLRLSL